MLKIGSNGIEVRQLQLLLNEGGARINVDGWFGIATHAAVMAAQQRLGLVVDGVAGPKTITSLRARDRPAKLLAAADLERAAQRLDLPLAAVRAVNVVESRGNGFLDDGRPVILFERHIMYRQLDERRLDVQALAKAHPGIINPVRGGYIGGSAEHGRFKQAEKVNRECAIEACSWGLFQIMGFHWQPLGYKSADEFEARMRRSEADQLDAFVRFIEADPTLLKALRAGKWERFAAGYNGAAYRDNLYDIKLARAFERFSEMEQAA